MAKRGHRRTRRKSLSTPSRQRVERLQEVPDGPSTIAGRLRPLGYKIYAEYLASDHWRDIHKRYRQSNRPQRCACGAVGTQLHHLTYVRLGAERLDDLILVCKRCHRQIHHKSPRSSPKRPPVVTKKVVTKQLPAPQGFKPFPLPYGVASVPSPLEQRKIAHERALAKNHLKGSKRGTPKPWDKFDLRSRQVSDRET